MARFYGAARKGQTENRKFRQKVAEEIRDRWRVEFLKIGIRPKIFRRS